MKTVYVLLYVSSTLSPVARYDSLSECRETLKLLKNNNYSCKVVQENLRPVYSQLLQLVVPPCVGRACTKK